MADHKRLNYLCEICRVLFCGEWVHRECDLAELSTVDEKDANMVDVDEDEAMSEPEDDRVVSSKEEGASMGSDERSSQDYDSEDNDFYEKPDWTKLDSSDKAYCPPHHSYYELQTSAANGCHLCTILWFLAEAGAASVESMYEGFESALSEVKGVAVVRPDPRRKENSHDCVLEVSYFRHGLHTSRDAYLFGINVELQHDSIHLPEEPQDSSISMPVNTITNLQKWIDECFNTHESCRTRQGDITLLPTRLLDLGALNEPANVSLCETHSLGHSISYMTLSHRWGTSPVSLRLLKENYNSFRRSIPFSTIPQPFHDAISVTRSMGIRYLWIDALCILQDSETDWAQEAANMHLIYSKSHLNIAATNSEALSGGLFYDRNAREAMPCVIQACWTGHMPGTYCTNSTSDWERRIDQASLNSRGWVFQERLLSPRTIHFAPDKIYWDCAEVTASETYPCGMPPQAPTTSSDYALESFANLATLDLVASDDEDLSIMGEGWLSIVQGYTKRKLTFPKDKLIALGGVARATQSKMGVGDQDYLAGFWRHDLPTSLLWRMATSGSRHESFTAPSWSWASMDGAVHFTTSPVTNANTKLLVDILEASIHHSTPDAFGSVTGGHLTLRGPLYRILLSDVDLSTPSSPTLQTLQIGDHALRAGHGLEESLDDESLYSKWPTSSSAGGFLHFLRVTTSPASTSEERVSEGLLLRQISGVSGEYVRVGWLRVFHDDAGEIFASSSEVDAPEEGEYLGWEAGEESFTIRLR